MSRQIGFASLMVQPQKKEKANFVHTSYPSTLRMRPKTKVIVRSLKNKNKIKVPNIQLVRLHNAAVKAHTAKRNWATKMNTLMNKPGSKLYKEPNWQGDRSILTKLKRTGQRIGTKSVHGVVKRLLFLNKNGIAIDNRYVIKTIKFKQQQIMINNNKQEKLKWFLKEIAIGTLPNIDTIGPKIYAWRMRPDGAEYIMDNVEMGVYNSKTFTYYDIKRRYKNKPEIMTLLNNIVAENVDRFHKISHGEHGDLHGENILFVFNPRKPDELTVRLIDYGSWKPESNIVTNKNIINSTNKNTPVYRLKNGGKYRKDANMLVHLFS